MIAYIAMGFIYLGTSIHKYASVFYINFYLLFFGEFFTTYLLSNCLKFLGTNVFPQGSFASFILYFLGMGTSALWFFLYLIFFVLGMILAMSPPDRFLSKKLVIFLIERKSFLVV